MLAGRRLRVAARKKVRCSTAWPARSRVRERVITCEEVFELSLGELQGGFNWSSQHLDRGGVVGRPAGWMKELTGRSPMKSPGAPSHRREVEREFWREIARGLTSEDAAIAVGASQAVGARWFRHRGGMPSISLAPLTGRYLSFAEREEIALLKTQGLGVREIARRLLRAGACAASGAQSGSKGRRPRQGQRGWGTSLRLPPRPPPRLRRCCRSLARAGVGHAVALSFLTPGPAAGI